MLIWIPQLHGADLYWTNNLGGDFTNATLWMAGAAPGIGDTANFTNQGARKIDWTINVTNANATLSTLGSAYTNALASSTWTVTNQFLVLGSGNQTSIVTHTSGTLVVTNSTGTASFVVGQEAGSGFYALRGGTVIADHVYATNATAQSIFSMDSGVATFLGDSIISNAVTAQNLEVGRTAGETMTWNIRGGLTTILNASNVIGTVAGATGIVNVSGSSTVLSNNSMVVGLFGNGNTLTISNSATVVVTNLIKFSANATSDSNAIFVLSGGRLFLDKSNFLGTSGSNSLLVISGTGSMLTNGVANFLPINGGFNQRMVISNGGFVSDTSAIPGNGATFQSSVLVTDPGSVWTNSGSLTLGAAGSFSTLTLSNGAEIHAGSGFRIGSTVSGSNNTFVATGLGTLMRTPSNLAVGSNSSSKAVGSITILDQATVEANSIRAGENNSGAITNFGGIFQFTSASPTIQSNSTDAIILTNGTISFRNLSSAPVFITNQLAQITFQGNNTYQLNHATNALLDTYTFTNGLGSTNFMNLTLLNGTTLWQATNTTFGAGSTLLITNTIGTVQGIVTNAGAIRISASTATFQSNLFGSGTLAVNATSTLNLSNSTVVLTGNGTNAGTINLRKSLVTLGNGSGGFDSPGAIDIGGTSQLTFSNTAGTITVAGVISGAGSLQKYGGGTTLLSGNNTFTGAVTNGAGTLQLEHANALGATTSISVQGGTLLFNTGLTNTSANVVLNGGEIQETDDNISLGTLTLTANSSFILNAGGSAGSFRFASATNTVGAGAKLTVYGWSYDSANDKGSDDLIFFTDSAFESASFLNNVTFFGLGPGARILSTGELVPLTPEPGSLLVGWILSCLFGFRIFIHCSRVFHSASAEAYPWASRWKVTTWCLAAVGCLPSYRPMRRSKGPICSSGQWGSLRRILSNASRKCWSWSSSMAVSLAARWVLRQRM